MDRNLFLAIGLSMVVIIGYYALFPPQPAKKPDAQNPPAVGAASVSSSGEQRPPAADSAEQISAGRAPGVESEAVSMLAGGKRMITVETPRYRARIDRRGGHLVSLVLKDYVVGKNHIDWGDVIPPLRSLIPKQQIDTSQLIEMVNREMATAPLLGLAFVGDPKLSAAFTMQPYRADKTSIELTGYDAEPRKLTLEITGPNDLTVRKVLTFYPDSYVIDYSVSIINYGASPRYLRVQSWFGENLMRHQRAEFRAHVGPMFESEGSVDTEDLDGLGDQFLVRQVDWMGMTDNYFLTAVQPETPISYGIYQGKLLSQIDDEERWGAYYGVELPALDLQPAKMINSQYRLYIGPKHVEEMRKFGPELENSLDLTLDILARPLLAMLRWFHGYANNYGIAIILLTIVVRVGLFPLTYKGMVAMKRMQKLQPKIKAMREKYKNDKERINKEMMEMYKRHKVNPLGGCLPIALQIPIFFALYSALLGAIELRHSPFFLWIVDLSDKDPLYVTPILMGASMFLQQRLTPTTLDPTQAKIMMWMPVIFTAFMVNFPSGLVLYWLTSNFLSVAQQLIINRINVPDPVEQEAA